MSAPSAARFTRVVDHDQRVVLQNISWPKYKAFCDLLQGEHVRLTYDRGKLEIMVTSIGHERWKSILGLLICTLAAELNKLLGLFGSFTHQREDLVRGLEPDQCFYLKNFAAVCDKEQIDLSTDPPPDLAIEVEISRSVLDRLGIYAALQIAEIWRFDGKRLQFLVLRNDDYVESKTSIAFPEIDAKQLVAMMKIGKLEGDGALIRAVRAWAAKRAKAKVKAKRRKRK